MSKQPTVITATEMQVRSGEIIRRAVKKKEHFVVERGGYPVVAIIPIDEYEAIYLKDIILQNDTKS